jgi:regulatory protein YycI of two-component signal transduction system YycFG
MRMDWSRAKSVLILAFLLLNVVLGYQLWENVSERLNTGQKLGDLDADTLRMMKERGIGLAASASIPSETPALRDLTYRFKTTGTAEEVQLEKPVDSRIIFDEKELLAQLGDVIPDLAQYQYDQLASTDGVFVLYRMAGGRPMFDVKLELFYSNQNQKITAYRQTQVELVDADDALEAHEVLPASKAIVPLVDKYLEEGSVIKEISLGYHGQLFNSETQYAAPSWRVLLENGKPFYVHAISAEVVQEKAEDAEAGH